MSSCLASSVHSFAFVILKPSQTQISPVNQRYVRGGFHNQALSQRLLRAILTVNSQPGAGFLSHVELTSPSWPEMPALDRNELEANQSIAWIMYKCLPSLSYFFIPESKVW